MAFMSVHFHVLLAVSPFPQFVAFVQKSSDSGLHPSLSGYSVEYLMPKKDVPLQSFFCRSGQVLPLAASAEVTFIEALTPCIQYIGYV